MSLNINLNLPTLPTSDEKDAMDGANAPDSTNVFATMNDIPAAQVNSDWNAVSGVEEILNKPTIPAAQIQSDWNQSNNLQLDYIKNKPTIPSTATDVDALKRDGSNANSDVDLGAYALNAKSIKINGTAGAGHLSLKHQSANITASGSESAIGADSSGNPVWKNDGNAIQQIQLNDSVNNATAYTTPINGDKIGIWDSTNSLLKAITWTNIKASLKTYFDGIYTTTSAVATQITTALSGYLTSASAASTYEPIITTLPISKGGTNSGTALNNGRVMISNGGSIIEGDTSTYPTTTELSYVKGVTSSIQTQLGNIAEWKRYSSATFNPADSTTYYISTFQSLTPTTGFTSGRQFKFMKTGTSLTVMYQFTYAGNGSSESVTAFIRNTTTSTNTTLGTFTLDGGANATTYFTFTVSLAVNTTDVYALGITCPAWVTNPTSVFWAAEILNKL